MEIVSIRLSMMRPIAHSKEREKSSRGSRTNKYLGGVQRRSESAVATKPEHGESGLLTIL